METKRKEMHTPVLCAVIYSSVTELVTKHMTIFSGIFDVISTEFCIIDNFRLYNTSLLAFIDESHNTVPSLLPIVIHVCRNSVKKCAFLRIPSLQGKLYLVLLKKAQISNCTVIII